jgi:hypothetical protein
MGRGVGTAISAFALYMHHLIVVVSSLGKSVSPEDMVSE